MCLIINASNELAVNAFLDGKISFLSIFSIIEESMNVVEIKSCSNIEEILDADKFSREKINQIIKKYLVN